MDSIRFSRAMYEWLLAAYPADFRTRFGGEMVSIFGDQIDDAWRTERGQGVVRVWGRVLWELVSVAIPLRLAEPIVIATAVSALATSVLFLAFFRSIAPHCAK